MITLPLHMKNDSLELLKESEDVIFTYLNARSLNDSISKTDDHLMLGFLECCHACGFLYIILARFSLTTLVNDEDPIYRTKLLTPPNRIEDANRFLTSLNSRFKLAQKLAYLRKNLEKADLTKALLLVIDFSN